MTPRGKAESFRGSSRTM